MAMQCHSHSKIDGGEGGGNAGIGESYYNYTNFLIPKLNMKCLVIEFQCNQTRAIIYFQAQLSKVLRYQRTATTHVPRAFCFGPQLETTRWWTRLCDPTRLRRFALGPVEREKIVVACRTGYKLHREEPIASFSSRY